MEKGAADLLIGWDRVFSDVIPRAAIGDLFWVKEPYFEVQSGPTGLKHVHEMIPGSPLGMIIPLRLKPYFHLLKQRGNRPAAGLRKGESRAFLRIINIEKDGFRCSVHMENVDVLLCRAA
jgi:hypothetical protein